jgi:opacity protein-like surface antigen
MNTRIATTLLAAASLAAFAEEPAAAELEEEGNLPGVTLGADYCSRQVTRGLPDNTEGIVTLSAALEWAGFTAEGDGIFNTTDIAEEDGFDAWDNTEIDYVLGYGFSLDTDSLGAVELGADYTYEYDQGGDGESDHMSYLHASVGLDDVFLSPTLECEWMLDNIKGQYYALVLSHEFELADTLALTLSLTEGLANNKYNADDLGCDCWGFRDTTLTAELEWAAAEFLSVKPYISYSDHLNGHFRHPAHYVVDEETSHHVAQFYGGVALELAF